VGSIFDFRGWNRLFGRVSLVFSSPSRVPSYFGPFFVVFDPFWLIFPGFLLVCTSVTFYVGAVVGSAFMAFGCWWLVRALFIICLIEQLLCHLRFFHILFSMKGLYYIFNFCTFSPIYQNLILFAIKLTILFDFGI